MPFRFEPIERLPGLVRILPQRFADDRGWFQESFKASDFEANGVPSAFPQDNVARNVRRGVLRGLHFQRPPVEQGKLVRCTRGRVWDVAVDIRRGSKTAGRWHGEELSAQTGAALWIPEGFAHGYVTLTDVSEVEYKVTREFRPDLDGAIRWDDPDFGITWPIEDPILSAKDAKAPSWREARRTIEPHS